MAGIIQKLMQATGKSSDEIMELLGKKAATTGDDISEQAALANLRKEASDASVPMGSGKNLDVLQDASEGVTAGNKAKLDQLQKDAERNINAQDLGLSYDDVPAKKYSSPDASGIKASKAAAPGLATSADELVGSVPLEEKKKMNLKQIAGLLGLTMGGAAMMGGEDEPPMTPQDLAQQNTPEPMSAPVPEGMEARIASDIKSNMATNAAAPTESAPVETEPDMTEANDRRNFEQEVIEGQRLSGQNTMWANLARAAQQAGAGIASLGAGSQVKNDYSGIDSLIASAGQPSKDVTARHGARKEQLSYNKAQDELRDDAKMRDPDSEVSRLTTELAAKAGLIKPGQKMSAMALKNSGVNLGTLLSTIEAGKSRAEAAKLARETRSEDTKLKLEAKSNEEALKREDKRKLTTEEIEDRRRNIMDNITLVKQAVQEKGTTELMGPHNENVQRMIDAIAVDMAKLADPNSVARPSEVEMFKKGLFSTGSEGMKLSNKSALDIMDKFTKEVDRRAANAYKVRNITPNNSPTPVPGSTPDSVQPRDNNSKQSSKQIVEKQYSKSRDKTRIVYSDGTEELKDGRQ